MFFSSLPATSGIIAKTSNSNTKGILGTWAVGGYGTAYYQTVDVSGRIVSFGPGTIPTQSNYSDVQDPNGNYYLNINKTTVTLGSNITANTINLPGGSTSTLAIGNNNVTLNGILFCGGTTKFTSTGSGKVVIGADNELVVCCFNGNGKTLSIDVPIVNGAAGNSAVTIAGDNFGNGGANENVFFTGAANTYTGPTTVNSATLVLNKAANVIAVPGDLNIAGGTVDLKNDNQIASTANLTFSGTGQFGDYFHSNYGLVKAQTVASVTVTGNQGGFYIAPGGALTVSAALFITGNNGAGPLGNGTIAYRMDGTATMTVGSLSLDNSFFYVGKASADTPTLTLNGDFTGANTSSLNTTATAPKFVLFGSGTHTHNFNITSGTTTIAPPISETATTTAALTKTGAGTLALTGTNTYSGDTTVTEGILAVNGSSIKDSNKLIISGGKVQPTGTEVVDTLFFGTAQQAAGTWGATGSGATHIDNSHFAGAAGVVSVTSGPVGPVGGYDAWAATNAGSEAASLDFDSDGVPNGVEYFMGIGPTDPVFTPTPTVVNGKITWPHSATATDITYRVLTSENLTSWSDVTAQTTDAGGFLEYILPKTSPELFVRLEVVAP